MANLFIIEDLAKYLKNGFYPTCILTAYDNPSSTEDELLDLALKEIVSRFLRRDKSFPNPDNFADKTVTRYRKYQKSKLEKTPASTLKKSLLDNTNIKNQSISKETIESYKSPKVQKTVAKTEIKRRDIERFSDELQFISEISKIFDDAILSYQKRKIEDKRRENVENGGYDEVYDVDYDKELDYKYDKYGRRVMKKYSRFGGYRYVIDRKEGEYDSDY